jgi:hypothetical protein
MQRKAIWASLVVVVLAMSAIAQAQGDYLDVFTVQVRPDKRADFDALNKKIVAANRQNAGDTWLAMETTYGPGNRVTFISTRQSYGDIEKATGMFYAAMEKAFGKAATEKMFADFNQCLVSSRSEVRHRRWDLSANAPTDPAAYAKMIADSRWLRTTAVHVRPGQSNAFEGILKDLKAAREKSSPPQLMLVSQAVAGQEGTVYYVTTLQTSLAGFDSLTSLPQLLGTEGYDKFLKASAESVSDTETVINRFVPELSNPPQDVVASAPDFWTPKPAAGVHAKSATKSPVVPAKETTKMEDKK